MSQTLDLAPLLAPLRELGWDGRALGPLLQQVRRLGLEESRACFARSEDPDGRAWRPSRKPRGKTLVETGRLRAGTRGRVEGSKVVWTNNVPYGVYLARGTRRLPARRFLGIGRRGLPALERALADFRRAVFPE